jgi:uncharacterized protein (TIGR03382 family)
VCWPSDPGGGNNGSPGDVNGGCQTSRGSGASAGLLLLMALLFVRRRRLR